MGSISLAQVVDLLNAGGIRAETAFPAERITRITGPVAAVSLAEVDQEKNTVTVLVEILVPKESGGYVCQQKALAAYSILADAGAVCSQGGCEFLNKGNVFRVSVRAVFRSLARSSNLESIPEYTIITGPLTLQYACGFSAEQALDSTVTSLLDAPWEFTVEEFFPWGVQDTLEADEPFMLDLRCMGNIDRFEECKWTHRQRIAEELGIRQIRKGKAKGRIITSG